MPDLNQIICIVVGFYTREIFDLRNYKGLYETCLISLKVLTLKESVNIDHMVAAQSRGTPREVERADEEDTGGRIAEAGGMAAPVVTPSLAPTTQAMPQSYKMAAPLDDAEFTALLMASPLYQKLEQIKKSLKNGAGKFGRKTDSG